MKRIIVSVALLSCMAVFGTTATAQDAFSMTPEQYKEFVLKYDGQGFFDNLGVPMYIAAEGNISKKLQQGGSSDSAVYENLQLCHRMYKGYTCVPQYVVTYVLEHFDQYKNYYVTYLSQRGDPNEPAAVYLLLSGFHGKCKSVNKSYESFMALCDNFTEEAANDIVSDKGKNNGYRGAAIMLLSSQLAKRISGGTVGEISGKTKKKLVKTYDGLLKECDKAMKNGDEEYNKSMVSYKEMFELIKNNL